MKFQVPPSGWHECRKSAPFAAATCDTTPAMFGKGRRWPDGGSGVRKPLGEGTPAVGVGATTTGAAGLKSAQIDHGPTRVPSSARTRHE